MSEPETISAEERRVIAYHHAWGRLRRAHREVLRIVRQVSELSERCKDWRKLRIRGVPGGDAGAEPGSDSFDASDWPAASALAQALDRWHSAREAASHAWKVLDDGGKDGFLTPDDACKD